MNFDAYQSAFIILKSIKTSRNIPTFLIQNHLQIFFKKILNDFLVKNEENDFRKSSFMSNSTMSKAPQTFSEILETLSFDNQLIELKKSIEKTKISKYYIKFLLKNSNDQYYKIKSFICPNYTQKKIGLSDKSKQSKMIIHDRVMLDGKIELKIADNISETDSLSDNPIEMSQEPMSLEEEASNSTKKLSKILNLFSFNEEILGKYPVLILKRDRTLLESILVLGETCFAILTGISIDNQGNLIESEGIIEDYSRFLSKNPVFPIKKAYDFTYNEFIRLKCFKYLEIKEIHGKRFGLKPVAIEFFTEKKSFFLICPLTRRDEIFSRLILEISS